MEVLEQTMEQFEESITTDLSEEMESSEQSVKQSFIQWKIIKEYPDYRISNTGIVKNFKTKKEPNPTLLKSGYYKFLVSGCSNSKDYSAHKLVAEYFVENTDPDKFKIVEHIDQDKSNNNASNLRWTNRFEKNKRIKSLKFDPEDIEKYDSNGKLIEWKIIKEYPDFRISNTGIVKNFITGSNPTPYIRAGYYYVKLKDCTNENTYFVHKLVAEYFIENPDPNYFNSIFHSDGNRFNNDVSNLKFTTRSDQIKKNKSLRPDHKEPETYDSNGKLIEWKTIKDYPDYRISNTGIVKNFKYGNELKPLQKTDKN